MQTSSSTTRLSALLFVLAALLAPACTGPTPSRASGPRALPEARVEDERSIRFGTPEELEYAQPFFPDADHDPALPAPETLLGRPVGGRPAHHAEVLAYFRQLAQVSPRVTVHRYGVTHEGRELIYAVIGSEANLARLEELEGDLRRLSDPRGLSDEDGARLARDLPAVAWMGYSIHGDEMSGVDAALALAHHFAADRSAATTELLDEVLIVMDPIMNPDGRERIYSQLEQAAGYAKQLSATGMHHGRWPRGRGNHYLFDMNRDWMPGVCPETRGRWRVLRRYPPQLFIDAHEMGALDTFLFYPPNDPVNKSVPRTARKWWRVFGDEQAEAFDRHGWSYYTREWAEYWYPGYSDSWGTLSGAIGILYEQAAYNGQAVRRESGEVATYREAVHRQVVSSLANLTSLVQHKEEVLADYLAGRRENVAADTPGNERMFVLVPGRHPEREARFVARLAAQGVEVQRASDAFTGREVEDALRAREDEREFPAGSLVISARQPQGALVRAYLEWDPRYDLEDLESERRELERKHQSKIYDLTAWNLAMALDLDGYWCDALDLSGELVGGLEQEEPGIEPAPSPGQVYGWIVDGDGDRAPAFAAHALRAGLAVHLVDSPLESAGRAFGRGSLLVRRVENGDDAEERVLAAAVASGVRAFATSSARAPQDGPDLGGGHFVLLEEPRVALLGNSPVSPDVYGHTWHLLDAELGLPITQLDAQSLGHVDLRAYNVLVVPPGSVRDLLEAHEDALETWVRAGGTLIASGSAAAALTRDELGLTNVRLRRDALDELERYAFAVERERRAGRTPIDETVLWATGSAEEEADEDPEAPDKPEEPDGDDESGDPDAERLDRWRRLFSPRGVLLRGEVNSDEWLTAGCGDELPVFFRGTHAFLSERPVHTPVRLAARERLRLSGLLWPEAAERIADTAFATVERRGRGQVILFASQPGFRGMFEGTGRLLANAVVYGPGAGASPPHGH